LFNANTTPTNLLALIGKMDHVWINAYRWHANTPYVRYMQLIFTLTRGESQVVEFLTKKLAHKWIGNALCGGN
jgi:hypothetical protein